MGKDIPLGKIAGIRLGVDVTVFLAVMYYTVVLATRGFPAWSEGHSTTAYWVAAFCGSMLLYLSLLAHEIGHALVARDEGIGVHSMALNLLGGVTRMESSPTTPGAEFRVSVVGPIASASCGIVLIGLAQLLPDNGLSALAGTVLSWAGGLNLFLAALNMIPASPLDGGKVLSAAIWKATGNQITAHLWSGGAGVAVGASLTYWGFKEFRSPTGRSELAIGALIVGIFIAASALQQLRSTPILRAMEGRLVSQAMAANPPTAPGWTTIDEFLRSAHLEPQHQAYPVISANGEVEGLLTAAAIRAVPPQQWMLLPARELAYPLDRVLVVRPNDSLLTALQKLDGAEVSFALVVAEDGRVVGTLDPTALERIVHEYETARLASV